MVSRVLATAIAKGITSLSKGQKASKLYKKIEGRYFKKTDLFPYRDKKGNMQYRLTNPDPSQRLQWGTRRDPVTGKRIKVPTTMMKKNVNPVTGKIYYTERTGEKAKAAEVKGIINALHSKYGKDRFYQKGPLMTKIINRTITNPKNEIVFDPVNTRQVNLIKNRMGQSPWKQSEDFLLPGSPTTKKLDSFLNQRYMNTDKKNYQMMFNSEVEKNFPNLSSKQIQVHRKKHGLNRELHQDYGGLEHGANKIKARLHSRHKYLDQDQLNALSDESKRMFKHDYVREGRRYSDEQIDEVFNLLEDVLPMTLRDPVFKAGVAKRKLIREAGEQVGHYRGTVADTPYEAGFDPGLFGGQLGALNERQSQLHKKIISAAERLKKGESTPEKIKGTRSSFGRIREALREMREKEMTSQYTDEFGGPRYFGYQAGGLVGIGSKILAKLAKKLSEKELKMLMGSLWKGVDPKQAPHYKAWAKNRWGPGYKWPYKKSRIRGPEMKKSHYASLSDQAKEDLRKRYAKRLAEYIAKQKEKNLRNARYRALSLHKRLSRIGFDESRLRNQHRSKQMRELEKQKKLKEIDEEARKGGDWDMSYQEKYDKYRKKD